MAISQKRFAAEVIDAGSNVHKFDDIGCMLRWLGKTGDRPAAIFVADYRTRQWLAADKAYFVRTSKVDTPMGGGILAFATSAPADSAARDFAGAVTRYASLRP